MKLIANDNQKKIHEAVGLVLESLGGEIILQKRENIPNITLPGAVTVFGGAIESGETPLEAAVRELEEELSVNVPPERFSFLGHYWNTKESVGQEQRIHVFVVQGLDQAKLQLKEGETIIYLRPGLEDQIPEFHSLSARMVREFWDYKSHLSK